METLRDSLQTVINDWETSIKEHHHDSGYFEGKDLIEDLLDDLKTILKVDKNRIIND